MTAAAALLEREGRFGFWRWTLAALFAASAHAAVFAAYRLADWSPPVAPPPQEAAIMIELAPVPVAPASPNDVAPGPEMIESPQAAPEALPPPPAAEHVAEPEVFEPLPTVETPAVVTLPLAELKPPPEPRPAERPVHQKPAEKVAEKPPAETPVEQKTEPKPIERKPDPKPNEVLREKPRPPAPQTTAAPRSDRQTARTARAPSPGRVATSSPSRSWIGQLMAHINRHKRYPASAQSARQQGVVTLAFTMNRSGRVLSRRVVRSSGVAALDAEALAMIQRAQPLPSFPAEMRQASQSFTVPVHFAVR